jgi:hypothetical protein
MTNPNNAIGTNAAYSGRTSPNALNDITASFTAGIVSGWECVPKTGMTVKLGGVAGTRDVALAEDNAGNKLTINNRSGAPVEVTLSGAPSTNNRIDAIVAYVDNPSTGDNTTTDNPTACGIIAVSGTVAANPTAPSEATIRSAITTDGATGGTAYYIVLATIYVGTNVTTIGSGVITAGTTSQVETAQVQTLIADLATTAQNLADFQAKFTMTQFADYPASNITASGAGGFYGNLHTASNADGSVGKIYGFLGSCSINANGAYLQIQTPFRPTTAITIADGCLGLQIGGTQAYSENFARFALEISTDGKVKIPLSNYGTGRVYNLYLPPCLYFMVDFGD